MGYLDSSTVTVDAILTKHGRKILAEGGSLGISNFALADDGVDYDLWNTSHPSGSANYGDAITSLPQLEAVPDDVTVMRYKLVTLPRKTIFMPYITGISTSSITLDDVGKSFSIEPSTVNGSDTSYQFLFNDEAAIFVKGGKKENIGGSVNDFLLYQNVPMSAAYTGKKINIEAKSTKEERKVSVRVTGLQTGAVSYIDITVNANQRQKAS
jgi:hypothetical protein